MCGGNTTQRVIAKAAGVTEVTIRNRYKGLKESLKIRLFATQFKKDSWIQKKRQRNGSCRNQ